MPKARSLWNGIISMSAVNIPVKLYPAVREHTIHFHQLHDSDHVRLQQKLMCPAENVEVHREHVVKGYEVAPDRYVIVTEEEIERAKPAASRMIEVDRFVAANSIDPLFYDKPYYLGPGEHGANAYILFAKALQQCGRIGIARFVMRGKAYVAAIRPLNGALCLFTLRYSDEVMVAKDLDERPARADLPERELKVAQQIIDAMSKHFDPSQYKDEYIGRVRELIEKKAHGEKVATSAPRRAARTTNLLSALQASLKSAQSRVKDRKPVAAAQRRSR